MEHIKFVIFVTLGLWSSYTPCNTERSFDIDFKNNTFVKDGEAFRYISGSILYTRVPHQYWDDRLHKMAAAGLNAISTYVPWNAHETVQGVFNFKDQYNITNFLQAAQKYNLSVILRPGPYICAEWEFGGLPAWLLKYPNMKVRTSDPNYIISVTKWFKALYAEIRPMLYKNGGPIITIQIENEYGSYPACDFHYLITLRDLTWSLVGDDVVLFTTDGDGDDYLKCGVIPDVYATVDFAINKIPEQSFAVQRHASPLGPLVNSEFYAGWLDSWGHNHSIMPTAGIVQVLDVQLALGANVNLYMFTGGTNFGFWNGANVPFVPQPTSYDYDAPLTEAGDITDKYMQIKDVVSKYSSVPYINIPPNTPKAAYGQVKITAMKHLVEFVTLSVADNSSVYPLTMEVMDHYYGFILYEHQLTKSVTRARLDLPGVRDRAHIMVGTPFMQTSYSIIDRTIPEHTVYIDGNHGDYIYILVENMGRINYVHQPDLTMDDNLKGLVSNVTLDDTVLTQWRQYPVPTSIDLPDLARLTWSRSVPATTVPSIVLGELIIHGEPQDSYLDVSLWTKGVAFINGVNIGRYWPHKGPQVRLYVPQYVFKTGTNSIILMEVEKRLCEDDQCHVTFHNMPLIDAMILDIPVINATILIGPANTTTTRAPPRNGASTWDLNFIPCIMTSLMSLIIVYISSSRH